VSPTNIRSLKVFTAVSSIWGIVFGLIGPFYAVYIAKISGGMEKLGLAFSIMILVQAFTSYFVGHYSDKLGRKPFLFASAYTDACVLFAYTLVTEAYQIYILQAFLGVTNAVSTTARESLLADLTKRERRGSQIGKYNGMVNVFSAVGMTAGGYLTKYYGLKSIFYFGSVIIILSTILLFFIREPRND